MCCPVCGCSNRDRLYDRLVDLSFRIAPGRWTLWSCCRCGSVYVDPRPTSRSLHRAYSSYYTHDAPAESARYSELSAFGKIRRSIANGYANWRYGARLSPASRLGPILAHLVPPLRSALDRKFRHLPYSSGDGLKLLDLGCGNGEFLEIVRGCGWEAVGVEPDPKAVAHAHAKGLNVERGGIEVFRQDQELFDVITLSHVIEHVHDPVSVLSASFRLLKPGGWLWMETPNINSFGHETFREDWRGLEVPRHLVIFGSKSLENVLRGQGFVNVHPVRRPSAFGGLCEESWQMKSARLAGAEAPLPIHLCLRLWSVPVAAYLNPRRREFLTIIAQKPR